MMLLRLTLKSTDTADDNCFNYDFPKNIQINFNLITHSSPKKDKEAEKQVLLTDFCRDFQFSNANSLYVFIHHLLLARFNCDFRIKTQINFNLINHSSPKKDKEAEKTSFTHRFLS